MKAIQKVEFEIEGICPLLMDKWIDGQDAKTQEEYMKQAEKKVYMDEKGNPSIEGKAIKATMRLASSDLGRKMDAKKNRQSIAAGVFLSQECLPIIGKKKYDKISKEIVTRRGQGDKFTRVATFRPQFDTWKVKGIMNLIGVQPDFAMQALELAGLRYGLYGHRPDFGRFKVNSFKVVN